MRRAIIPLVALVLTSLASPAAAEQGSWQPRLSLYSGQFRNIEFASATTAWAAGPGGLLLSNDGGASWQWTLNTPLRASDAAKDGLQGWAVGPGGAIFATSDGGATWTQQHPNIALDFSAIGALDAERAIAFGRPAGGPTLPIYTVDGGLKWQRGQFSRQLDFDSLAVLKGTSRAWASATRCTSPSECAGEGVLLASEDAGKTWDEIAAGQQLFDLQFVSASTGWAIGGDALFRTTNGGRTWSVLRTGGSFVNALSDNVVFLKEINSGNAAQIVKTLDGGATWTNVGAPRVGVTALRYFDAQHAVRSALDQTVEFSSDGGATWQAASVPAFATRVGIAFDFIDPSDGWAAGTKLLRTRDGGASWQAVSALQLRSVDFVSPAEGWAALTDCGDFTGPCQAVVFHSIDGGATWTEQVRHDASDTPEVHFVDRLNGWVTLGQDKPVLHTRDGGVTWSEQRPPGTRLAFANATDVWAATDPSITGGSVVSFVSRDGGDTWSPARSVLSQGCGSFDRLLAVDAAHAWFLSSCQDSHLFRTVDGGVSWQEVSMSGGRYQYMAFFSATDGVGVRADGQAQLFRTRDGGSTWVDEAIPPSTGGIQSYLFTDLYHGWLMQQTGGEARRGGPTDIVKQVFYSYSTAAPPTPPVVLPGTGMGHSASSTAMPLVALGVFGVLLLGAGGIVGILRRRHG